MKKLPKLLLTGVAFSLAILCVLFYWLAIRPQPVTRGTISLPGAPYATAGRDRLGVPHIESKSHEEVLWVQGYVTAQDRLWQMDLLRRISAGELAEVLGPSMLSLDRESRTLGFRRAVKSIVERVSLDNAFIESHRGNLPLEFPAPALPAPNMASDRLSAHQDRGRLRLPRP